MSISSPYYLEPRRDGAHLSLDGEWDFGYMPEQTAPEQVDFSMTARVPGTVYRQLFAAGKMPDPCFGVNGKQFDWVDDQVWYYRRRFNLDREPSETATLCFDGSCYFTRVWLNGQLLGDHEGMFGGPSCEVSGLLNFRGENEIVAEVRACNYRNPDFSSRNLRQDIPAPIAPWYLMRDNASLPGDFNVIGIWRSVRIEFLPRVHLSRPYLYTEALEEGRAVLHFEVEITDPEVDELSCLLSGSSREDNMFTFSFGNGNAGVKKGRSYGVLVEMTERTTGNKVYSAVEAYSPYDWQAGLSNPKYYECHHYQREIVLENPRVWFPRYMGEPELYDARVALLDEGRLVDEQRFAAGVRTVRREFTAGDKFRARWDRFQFVVNGQKVFLTGVNWMPIDHFLMFKKEEYRWSLETARDMGVMMIRVWSGGGVPESDDFYDLCDELGLMVWQDNLLANNETSNWDHDALLQQVCYNLYRIRNHPSLVIHCGGNEFNPYSNNNLASLSVIENAIQDLDPSREWVRTTPDRGSAHIYMDMEPSWYRIICRQIPFVAESGIHSFPSIKALASVVSPEEMEKPLPAIGSAEFDESHPGLRHHFAEYNPHRIPRMLSRASAISGLEGISLSDLVEATQIAAYEFYQVMADSLRENYPVTAGLMPWVYRRPGVAVGIQLMDGAGHPLAPYYAVKKAFQPLNITLALEHMTFRPGETVPLRAGLVNNIGRAAEGLEAALELFDPEGRLARRFARRVSVEAGARAETLSLGEFALPEDWTDKYFFVRLTLRNETKTLCDKMYWPRVLSLLADEEILSQRRAGPQPNLTMEQGPWLKAQVTENGGARLAGRLIAQGWDEERQWADVEIENRGEKFAFPVRLEGASLPCAVSDNYFALMPGESRRVRVTFFRREGGLERSISVSAWNEENIEVTL